MVDSKELRKQKVKEAKVNLILDAALKIFSEHGYTNARLEDIAAEAGFSKSALYNYYKEKDEIFFAVAIRVKNNIMKKVLGDTKEEIMQVSSVKDVLKKFLTAVFEELGNHFRIFLTLDSLQAQKLLIDLQSKSDLSDIENEYIESRMGIDKWLSEIIEVGKKNGEIKSKIASIKLAKFYGGLLLSIIRELHDKEEIGNINEIVNDAMMFLEEGFNFS